MEVLDCTNDSFSLEEAPTKTQEVATNIMETRGPRTTRESRTSAYKCKDKEETCKHQKLCTLLCRYGTSKHFASYLSSHGFKLSPTHLRTLTTDDLEDMLTRVRSCVNGKDTSNFVEEATFGFLKTGELLCTNSPINNKFKISGLTEALQQDASFSACLEVLQLEHGDYTQLPAHYRLLWSVVAAAMKQNAINSFLAKRQVQTKVVEEPTTPPTEDKPDILDFND